MKRKKNPFSGKRNIALLKEEIRRQDEKPTISRELMGQLYNLTLVNMVSAGQIKDAENLLNRITPVTARDKVYFPGDKFQKKVELTHEICYNEICSDGSFVMADFFILQETNREFEDNNNR